MTRRHIYVWLFVVFVSGLVLGSVSTHLFMERKTARFHGGRGAMTEVVMNKLTSKLDLANEQAQKIRPIVAEMQAKVLALRKENQPKIEAVVDEAIKSGEVFLNDEQKIKLHQLHKKLQSHWAERQAQEKQQ